MYICVLELQGSRPCGAQLVVLTLSSYTSVLSSAIIHGWSMRFPSSVKPDVGVPSWQPVYSPSSDRGAFGGSVSLFCVFHPDHYVYCLRSHGRSCRARVPCRVPCPAQLRSKLQSCMHACIVDDTSPAGLTTACHGHMRRTRTSCFSMLSVLITLTSVLSCFAGLFSNALCMS